MASTPTFSRTTGRSRTAGSRFSRKKKAEGIARAIMETAHTGMSGDGFIAVLPVEKLFRIRTGAEAVRGDI
jgi:nitrogen regulatory protein P-II 1